MAESIIRRELLNRWKDIDDEDANMERACADSSNHNNLIRRKEEWFLDVFDFLICLPREKHIWCGHSDLMGPLLETFYNYFKDERDKSPIRLLWIRISEELRQCIQCICQHHQSQEMYSMEYELNTVGPLLEVLRHLDEERVTQHLKVVNARIALGSYVPAHNDVEIVNIMLEVLMFPVLFDSESLVTEFQLFIEAIDSMHDLAFAGQQQYPGVYALLFFRSARVRSIGRRLAECMGKLRRAADLEPLQPLLEKCIIFLETEELPSMLNTSRPRMRLDCTSVWHGINALLGFLECSTFEEGILERYPIFLSSILNHISDESLQFFFAAKCLKRLFEMLGCKLWLKSALSASMMRNSLLGQCFHTQNEKSHKEIFDLFQPFLQSLEALQNGEHEEQRKCILYFLLHQVTVSSNFSNLMKMKARQIALLIIHRGYKMNPPCPPFECAHFWGPSLVASLKDCSLHSSLRQPAFDLIETIIVSDAAALIMSMLTRNTPESICGNVFIDLEEEIFEAGLLFPFNVEDDRSSWKEFSEQGRNASQEYRNWMCVPMLWLDVLVDINPSIIATSISKAVFWVRSRFPLVEPENNAEMTSTISDWLSSNATEISSSFGWKVPTGSDDGGRGMESKNSVKLSTVLLPLVRTLKRLVAHFVVQLEQGKIWEKWIWEPMMGDCFILLLFEPNDSVRHVAKCIIEHFSNARGLTAGLKFLCSCKSSLSAIFLGLRHALELIKLDSGLLNFQALHNFFFILFKILKEGSPTSRGSTTLNVSQFSSEGGFLRLAVNDSSSLTVGKQQSNVDLDSWEKFSYSLSENVWPIICRCLVGGKEFFDFSYLQMTCVRVLEFLPVAFERICVSFHKYFGSSTAMETVFDFKWLNDLIEWGKSLIKVIVRYWRQTMVSLMGLLKKSCNGKYTEVIMTIESILLSDSVAMDELANNVQSLSISLLKDDYYEVRKIKSNSKASKYDDLLFEMEHSTSDIKLLSLKTEEVQILNSEAVVGKGDVICISDDEMEKEICSDADNQCHNVSYNVLPNSFAASTDHDVSLSDFEIKNVPDTDASQNSLNCFQQKSDADCPGNDSQKDFAASTEKAVPVSLLKCMVSEGEKEYDSLPLKCNSSKKPSNETLISNETLNLIEDKKQRILIDHQLSATRLIASAPRRQVVQLNSPMKNRSGSLHRLEGDVKRFVPPNLDDWYKPILEIDYFQTVGLSSEGDGINQSTQKLMAVPTYFKSPEQYVEIFRPLVLEEFKAQLQSYYSEMSSLEDMHCGSLSIMSVERVDNFQIVRGTQDEGNSEASRNCSENDLVLLTRQPITNHSHDIHVVGKVERREKDIRRRLNILYIRFYLQNGSSRFNRARKLLAERSKWYLSRIMSITPQLREFQALSSVKYIPLFPVILKPDSISLRFHDSHIFNLAKLSQPLQQMLKSSYNDSQLQAISAVIGSSNSKRDFELSLIQGPPGTGKTRTILAIVSSLVALSSKRPSETKIYPSNTLKPTSALNSNLKSLPCQSAAIARAWQDAAFAKQLSVDKDNSLSIMDNLKRGRVLICAQSNAAVDEIVSRISSQGLYGIDGKLYKPYLVRIGNAKTVHQNSLPYFIDTLVDIRLEHEKMDASNPGDPICGDSSSALRSKLENFVDDIRFYEAKRANLRDRNSNMESSLGSKAIRGVDDSEMSDIEIEAKLTKLYQQKNEIGKTLASVQNREKKDTEKNRELKFKLRKSILKDAEIVVTTLSGCGGDLYGACSEKLPGHKFGNTSESCLFDAVVIDEAAQALEPATLIPLQLLRSRGAKCIMVGDPKQLPATVLSNVVSKFLYQCSMFERLQRAGYPVTMLTKQYRMHPEICRFPSMHFYDKKLLNGDGLSKNYARFHETRGLGPYVFFDITDGQEIHGKNSGAISIYNKHEADASVEILRHFRSRFPTEFSGGRICIITPYKYQLSVLRSQFSSVFGPSILDDLEFNTVDGFQGREVDIVVLSTVRASDPCSTDDKIRSFNIGFVADVRRMNVALTRAKVSLWILGNARTLQANPNWDALIKDAIERDSVISCRKPYNSIFHSAIQKSNSDTNPKKHCKQDSRNFMDASWRNEMRRDEQEHRRNRRSNKRCEHDLFPKEGLQSIVGDDRNESRSKEPTIINKGKATEKNSSKDKGDSHKMLKSEMLDSKESSEHGKIQPPVSVDIAHSKREGIDICGTRNQIELRSDLIAKRKQRKAVDDLLPSAFISSRKTGVSAKPVPAKRSPSPTAFSSGGIKPPKAWKAARRS